MPGCTTGGISDRGVPIWRFISAGDRREDCVQIVSLLLADVRQFDADAKNGAPSGVS